MIYSKIQTRGLRMIRIIVSTSLVVMAFGTDSEAIKPLNEAQQAVAKSYDINLVKSQKAYDSYIKELSVAQAAVLKDLEKIKADLNDTKKYTKLDISARADAIKEIDGKMLELKEGSLGEMVAARSGGDLLGESAESAKKIVGKWTIRYDTGFTTTLTVNKDSTATSSVPGKWVLKGNTLTFNWTNGAVDTFKLPVKNEMTGNSTACPNVYITRQ